MSSNGRKSAQDEESLQVKEKLILTKEVCSAIDVDQVWHFTGRFGKYQFFQMVILTIACQGLSPAILANVFVGKAVEFTCSYDNASQVNLLPNTSIVLEDCSYLVVGNDSRVVSEEKCSKYDYGKTVHNSFVSEWDTVCDRKTVAQLPQTMVMVGMAVGATLLPFLGDRYGRRFLTSGSQCMMGLVMVGMAFVTDIRIFLFLSFLAGAFNQGFMVGVSIQTLELFTTEVRSVIGVYLIFMWVTSINFLIPFAYFLDGANWRTLQIVYGLISAPVVLYFWWLDDSLRWLLANSKFGKVKSILKRACRMNNKSYDALLSSLLARNKQWSAGKKEDKAVTPEQEELFAPVDNGAGVATWASCPATKITLLDLFKSGQMRKNLAITCFTWMINAQIYYGLTLLSTSLAGDPYLNFFIGAVLELPSTLLSMYTLHRFGRKKTIITFILGAGISLMGAVLIETLADGNLATLQTALTLLGKFHISGSFNSLWIYTPELYPTNIRNKCVGFSSTCGRIGAIASPFFHILAHQAKWAPGALFTVCSFLSALLLSFLPETRWRELPHTIEEVHSWMDEDRRCKTRKSNVI